MLAIFLPWPGSLASFVGAALGGASSACRGSGRLRVSAGCMERAASAVRPGGSSEGAQPTAASAATQARDRLRRGVQGSLGEPAWNGGEAPIVARAEDRIGARRPGMYA